MCKHILVVASSLESEWQDGGTFVIDQAAIMKKFSDHKVNILSPQARHIAKLRRRKLPKLSGIEVERFNGIELWRGYFPYLLPRKNRQAFSYFGEKLFMQYVKKHGMPNLIWSQGILNSAYLARRLYRKFNIPYFVHEHVRMYAREKMPRLLRNRIRKIIEDSVCCVAVSENLRLLILEKIGVAQDKIIVIHNPVGMSFIGADFLPPPVNSPFTFISVSALLSNKHIDVIIQAFANIHLKHEELKLIVVGWGMEEEKLKSLVNSLRLSDSVLFVGRQSRMQVPAYLQKAHAFVAASEYETFFLALTEALVLGRPVATTRVGVAEQIVNESNGVLADSVTVTDIEESMRTLLSRNYDYKAISQYAKTNFHPKFFTNRISEIFNFRE